MNKKSGMQKDHPYYDLKDELDKLRKEREAWQKEKAELIEWLETKKDDLDYDKMSHQLTGLRMLTPEQRIVLQLTLQAILNRLGVKEN